MRKTAVMVGIRLIIWGIPRSAIPLCLEVLDALKKTAGEQAPGCGAGLDWVAEKIRARLS